MKNYAKNDQKKLQKAPNLHFYGDKLKRIRLNRLTDFEPLTLSTALANFPQFRQFALNFQDTPSRTLPPIYSVFYLQ